MLGGLLLEKGGLGWAHCTDGGARSRVTAWASKVRSSRHVPQGGGPGEEPGHVGGTMSLTWPGRAWYSPGGAGGGV